MIGDLKLQDFQVLRETKQGNTDEVEKLIRKFPRTIETTFDEVIYS